MRTSLVGVGANILLAGFKATAGLDWINKIDRIF